MDVYKCIQTISRWINIGGKLSKSVVLYDLNSLCIYNQQKVSMDFSIRSDSYKTACQTWLIWAIYVMKKYLLIKTSVHLINHAFLINKKCEKERSREREIENYLCFKWLSTHFFSLIGSLRIYFGCKLVTSLLYQKSKGCFVNILFYSAVFDISPFDASKAWWVLIIAPFASSAGYIMEIAEKQSL